MVWPWDPIQPVEGDPDGPADLLDRPRVEVAQQDTQVADEAGRNRSAGSDPQKRLSDVGRIGSGYEMPELKGARLFRPDDPHQGGVHAVQRGTRHEANHQLGVFHGVAA